MLTRVKYYTLAMFFAYPGITSACLWDSDTITDELQTRASQYDLVMGQFPSHGKVYYRKRIENLEPKAHDLTWTEQNDLAVAYIRTEQFTKALPILEKNLKAKPKDYHSLSNLGVLYKKQGDYTKASEYMQKALQIKPAGHMGLGDWYLKRLEWSKQHESPSGKKPSVNFLGEEYSALNLEWIGSEKTNNIKKRAQYLTKLIKNDRHFSDGYLVMGDLFREIEDLNLAMRCYQHAQYLKHPNPEVLTQRIDSILYHWSSLPYAPRFKDKIKHLEQKRAHEKKKFLTELKETEQWLTDFHAGETELIQQGKAATFEQTEAHKKTKRFRPTNS